MVLIQALDFQVVARSDWQHQKAFKGHTSDITAASWSPNGALLATAGADKSLILWETRSQKILKRSILTLIACSQLADVEQIRRCAERDPCHALASFRQCAVLH